MAILFTRVYIITTIKVFTCSYIKKVLKNVYAVLINFSATTKQLFRRNSICCLKNQAIFSQSEHRNRLNPSPPLASRPPVCFHLLFKDLSLSLHNKPFLKKGSLEEMEGVNDSASAFMHLNIKANK